MPDGWGHDLVWLAIAAVEAAIVALLAAVLVRRRAGEASALQAQLRVSQLRRAGAIAEVAEFIAQELGNPLASMMNNLGAARRLLAQRGAAVEEAAAAIGEALSDGERVAQVMARVRSLVPGGAPREAIDLNEIAREAIDLVRRARLAPGVAVTADHSGAPARVNGDSLQLLQVVMSLLANAVEAASASRRRSVDLRISAQERTVQLLVSDSGAGISEGERPHLFEPFFTKCPGGFGIGLPMARSIVEAHGGTLVAERPASGAALRITLPAAAAATAVSPPEGPARRGAGGAV